MENARVGTEVDQNHTIDDSRRLSHTRVSR